MTGNNSNQEIQSLKNLGPSSAAMLNAAGIYTKAELSKLGPVKAYLAIKQAGGKPTLNLLWAIAGALSDVHWTKVTPEEKSKLRAELAKLTTNDHDR